MSNRFEGYGVAIGISVLLHGVLVAWVVWGWEFSSEPQHRVVPKYVEAKLVTLKPKTEKKAAPKKKTKVVNLAEKRKQQARREKEKQRKLAEQKRLKAEKLARDKKLAEKKAAEKKAADAEKRRQQLEAEERVRVAEQERLQREADFANALAEEEAMLQAEEEAAHAQSYIGHIATLIEKQWSRPPSARNGMECVLSIRLVPTGEVISVDVVKSSGNTAFDRAAEQAVRRIGRFDVLKDMEQGVFDKYFRQLRLRFNPQDLRL